MNSKEKVETPTKTPAKTTTNTTTYEASVGKTTTAAGSNAISSRNFREDTTHKSNETTSDENATFVNKNPLETQKPEKHKIKSNYFFTIGYHLVLWIILAMIGFPFFYYFSEANKTGYPMFYGYGSLIGHYPKLNMMVPEKIYGEKDRIIHIKFDQLNQKSFEDFVNFNIDYGKADEKIYFNLNGFNCVNYEENENDTLSLLAENGTKTISCDALRKLEYGECAKLFNKKREFGFHDGTPCFILRFNKILDYIPYLNSNGNCRAIPECCDEVRVEIKCNSSLVEVYPKKGVSTCQWPYKGNEKNSYRSPMAMLQIKAKPNETEYVKCHAVLEDGQEYRNKKEFFENGPHTLLFIIDP
uniref:Uncharacterized protein n=1 Tax=Panagrolaimus sp. PS1159 TaxID=55785 RepID=A0AC35GF69_9BILA